MKELVERLDEMRSQKYIDEHIDGFVMSQALFDKCKELCEVMPDSFSLHMWKPGTIFISRTYPDESFVDIVVTENTTIGIWGAYHNEEGTSVDLTTYSVKEILNIIREHAPQYCTSKLS